MITWKGDCTGWIKWLEWGNNLEIVRIDAEWKHESSEISSALRNNWIASGEWLRDIPAWESIWKEERAIINTESFNWIHRKRIREWRMINLKLPEHLPENHRIRTRWKRMKRLHINKKDTWLRNLSPWIKGWEGGKSKATWVGWNKHRWEKA